MSSWQPKLFRTTWRRAVENKAKPRQELLPYPCLQPKKRRPAGRRFLSVIRQAVAPPYSRPPRAGAGLDGRARGFARRVGRPLYGPSAHPARPRFGTRCTSYPRAGGAGGAAPTIRCPATRPASPARTGFSRVSSLGPGPPRCVQLRPRRSRPPFAAAAFRSPGQFSGRSGNLWSASGWRTGGHRPGPERSLGQAGRRAAITDWGPRRPGPPARGPPGARPPRASSTPGCLRPAGTCRRPAVAAPRATGQALQAPLGWPARPSVLHNE